MGVWLYMPNDNELESVINTAFLGYKYRKANDSLYSADALVPLSLIKLYYSGKVERLGVNAINKNFIEKYIKNESLLEDVHNKDEVAGLADMYEYMHTMADSDFGVFSIHGLHKKLYSKCEFPEFGGMLRNCPAHIDGVPIDLYPADAIWDGLDSLEEPVEMLKTFACQMRYSRDYSQVKEFVKECMKVKCKLIQIHPFGDGNGRTTRCFVNKLFEMAGIPPVYIRKDEKEEYKAAMTEALRHRSADEVDDDSKFETITNFYLYKICDSIVELDINRKIRQEKKQDMYESKKKNKRLV